MHERQAKDTFSSEKMSITLILNMWMAHSPVCSGLTWRGSAPKRHQWPVVATGQLDSTGRDWGRSERGKDTDQSLVLALIGSGRVYCRKREIRRREEGGEGWGKGLVEGQRGACPIASSGWVCACLSVCPHTVEINLPSVELWTKRGKRLPGGLAQEKQQQTQPGHTEDRNHVHPPTCQTNSTVWKLLWTLKLPTFTVNERVWSRVSW